MKLWRIPEDQSLTEDMSHINNTETVVMAETADEASRLVREATAADLAPYPDATDQHLYDQVEEIGPIYRVPMYGYSW